MEVVLNQRDVLRIVQCMKVVIQIKDNETERKSNIIGNIIFD